MIDPAQDIFPDNVIKTLMPYMGALDNDIIVVNRPLRSTDANHMIGVFSTLWTPEQDSYEIGHSAPDEPTCQNYQIGVQGLVKHGDEPKGLSIHYILAAMIRRVLYKNQQLRNDISQLVVTDSGSTESFRKLTVRLQRLMNNEVQGQFVFVSTAEVLIETEIT